MRFFTADFHLGMTSIIGLENRPFANVREMDDALLHMCEQAREDDVIVHVGDLACFGNDRSVGSAGLSVVPSGLLRNVKAEFLNVRGNHDSNNRVKSVCESMNITLGKKYPNVTVCHYPSYDKRSYDHVRNGWICLCGHVHGKWKHCLDMKRQVLNVNVGVDAWGYRLVSEDELHRYIDELLAHRPDSLYRCIRENGKIIFKGENEK